MNKADDNEEEAEEAEDILVSHDSSREPAKAPLGRRLQRLVSANVGFFLFALLALILLCILLVLFAREGDRAVPFLQKPGASQTDMQRVNSITLFDMATGEAVRTYSVRRVDSSQVAWFNVDPERETQDARTDAASGGRSGSTDVAQNTEQVYCNTTDGLLYLRTLERGMLTGSAVVATAQPLALLPALSIQNRLFMCKWVVVVDDILVVGNGQIINLQGEGVDALKVYVLKFEGKERVMQQKTAPFSEFFPDVLETLRDSGLTHVAITSVVYEESGITLGLSTPGGPMVYHQTLDGGSKTLARADIQVASNSDTIFLTPLPDMVGMFALYDPSMGEITIVDQNGTQCSLPLKVENPAAQYGIAIV